MGYIREPKNIDFIIEPSVLTAEDKIIFSEAVAKYKKSGEILSVAVNKRSFPKNSAYSDTIAKIKNRKK